MTQDSGLTGKRRYRRVMNHPYGGLVLQVEVSEWNNAREGKPGKWVNVWRDATPGDITAEEVV